VAMNQNLMISHHGVTMAPNDNCQYITTHGLKPRLSSMMIGFGIPISFVTLAFFGIFVSFSLIFYTRYEYYFDH
jgi:hypothetical protein